MPPITRRVVLWPWQLPDGPGPDLRPVAIANPALETVWVRDGAGGERAASPQDAHSAADVLGYDLICRVITAARPELRREGFVTAPRAEGDQVVIDQIDETTVDCSDPRLIVPRAGFGIRLPSISHLRRVRLAADGSFVSARDVVLPDTTPFELYGKEDPSVTWLDGTPWLSYVGVSDWGITPVLAKGRMVDGAWVYTRLADAQGHHDNRDIKILPTRPNGLLWRHDRVNTLPWGPKRMTYATSPDGGLSWTASAPLMAGRFAWERHHIGAGAVPFLATAPDGTPALVSFYHGVHKRPGAVAGEYQTGVAYFDAADPSRLLGRLREPALPAWADAEFHATRQAATPVDEAEFQRRHGLFVIPGVVFTTGHTRVGDTQVLFSGVNDFCIERAELPGLAQLAVERNYAGA